MPRTIRLVNTYNDDGVFKEFMTEVQTSARYGIKVKELRENRKAHEGFPYYSVHTSRGSVLYEQAECDAIILSTRVPRRNK